jgi:hypothetical protein
MNEIVAIAKAKGLTMPDDIVERHIQACLCVKGGLPSSMLMDHVQQRQMEVEVHNTRMIVVLAIMNLSIGYPRISVANRHRPRRPRTVSNGVSWLIRRDLATGC